jgi:protein-S-isoprenylcysteine O-methyltransferase Ste14
VHVFHAEGKGTLAPWAPPSRLVVSGLYQYVRNPMYLAVLSMVLGIAWWRGSPLTGAYAALLGVAFHLRVVVYEEPRLARSFGEGWDAYARAVPRWLPRLRR